MKYLKSGNLKGLSNLSMNRLAYALTSFHSYQAYNFDFFESNPIAVSKRKYTQTCIYADKYHIVPSPILKLHTLLH